MSSLDFLCGDEVSVVLVLDVDGEGGQGQGFVVSCVPGYYGFRSDSSR